jgi:hypothetical protein
MSKIEVTMLYHDLGRCDACGDSSDTWEYSIYVDGELASTYEGGGCTGEYMNDEVLMSRVLKALGHTLEVTTLDSDDGEPVCITTYD